MIEGSAAAKDNIYKKRMGWGKKEEQIKGCLFLGTGDVLESTYGQNHRKLEAWKWIYSCRPMNSQTKAG
jgi:hypothetical protein